MPHVTIDITDNGVSPIIAPPVARLPALRMSKDVQAYILSVYTHLLVLCGVACIGCVVQMRMKVFYYWPMLGCLTASLLMVYNLRDYFVRLVMFLAFGFLGGWSLGPLIALTSDKVLAAFAITTLIFACFTCSAFFSRGGEWLELGGILSSSMACLFAVWVVSHVYTIAIFHSFLLYGGLVIFSLYVAYDTVVMLENAKNGKKDALVDSINLFIDFLGVFRRVLIILAIFSGDSSQ
eukprot:TRINITY_DN953_c1_g1_i15.p1 TRINITY_DN953_c1_g1~~TRINITY_DN953_c1_g1_i15.p1  ORF type:complete len:236 (+),score=16.15 TRINITY_DN953_c1_g1_i15:87-794(+)